MAITKATYPPHILCFTEHHLKTYQLDNILFQNYKLGAKFVRNIYKNGGVCIYLQILSISNTNVQNFCKEKDLDVCGINTFTAIVDLSRFNNSCLKSPVSTLVDLTFQSRALRSFSLNQLRNLSL